MKKKHSNEIDVLIFVEDPGAANLIISLPRALTECGRKVTVFSSGIASDYLLQQGVRTEKVNHDASPEEIIGNNLPRLLIVGTAENPDTLALKLIETAHFKGITSIGFIDAPMNPEYRFRGRSGDPLTYAPDWLIVPDEWTKQVFIATGFSETRTVVCGHPHFDYVMDKAKRLNKMDRDDLRHHLLPGVKKKQRTVAFITEGSARIKCFSPPPVDEYTMSGLGGCIGRTEIVLEEFLHAVGQVFPRPYLILRLHPKDRLDDYMIYLHEFDYVSSDNCSLELVYCADLVVGATSMLIMEAALMRRPTLSIIPHVGEEMLLASIRAGLTPYVTSRDELVSVLPGLLERNSEKDVRDSGNDIVCDSLHRVLSFLEKLLVKEH